MSEIFRVDRVEVPRWGCASGFQLDLPEKGFVVLYGPNESGKTSVATALAWLIAGPATQGTLQRFGVAGETLEASAKGRVGNSPLSLRVRVKVTQQSPGSAARETLEAALGDTSFGRREDLTPHMGGDLGGYRRLYWVEALKVADGSNLQEDVSLRAVFGRVNPFKAAESLGSRSQELLGALKGSARAGSARQLQTEAETLDGAIRMLSGARDNWARIETDLGTAGAQREGLETELQEREAELRSVQLALKALDDGIAAERARASSALADTPEPSDADRRLHEQLTLARTRIGDLQAAEKEAASAQRSYEFAFNTVDGGWRPLIRGAVLEEPRIDAANDAEISYRAASKAADNAEIEHQLARESREESTSRVNRQRAQWTQQYPANQRPEDVLAAHEARAGRADPAGAARPAQSGWTGRVLGRAGVLMGAACAIAAAVLAVVRGDWTLSAVAGVAAAALVVVSYRVVRTPAPSDPEQLRMAESIRAARTEEGEATRKQDDAETDLARQRRRVHSEEREYRSSLLSVGVPGDLIDKFSPRVVGYLRAVHKAQLANVNWKAARQEADVRLKKARVLVEGASDAERAATAPDAATVDEATVQQDAVVPRRNGEPVDYPAAATPPGIHDAAGAEEWLDAACARVDKHLAAVAEAGAATDALKRAVKHDEAALAHAEHASPDGLRAKKSQLEQECHDLKADLSEAKNQITNLEVDKRSLESQENDSARLALERSALTADIEGLVVRGLGFHLAASLLRDAAERHRKTQQPKLLRRTQEMVREVAGWRGVTINPHAPTGRKATDRTDNLLVDGPRGEHTAQRLSLGAQTLLYLALRLATVEDQAETRGIRLPVILDDVLVGLDDERAERCLEVLAEFSERHQMILLTCHESTMQRAKAAGAVVLPIPPA